MSAAPAELSAAAGTALTRLSMLLGSWSGQGRGMFPTIEPFEYRELFTVRRADNGAYLTYEQATELIDAQGEFIRTSHWESGVLRVLDDGAVELACVHNSGRVEVLRGPLQASDSKEVFTLQLDSILVLNDERMRSSSRQWCWSASRLTYTMSMATGKVEQGGRHLAAELVRSPD